VAEWPLTLGLGLELLTGGGDVLVLADGLVEPLAEPLAVPL
jgi:hypothetical protein